MRTKQYLTFDWHNLQYALEAERIQEIFPLPELTIITKTANKVIGILNLRGQIVPIIYLDSFQGHPLENLKISDYVIIFQWDGLIIGLIAHQVNAVLELNPNLIKFEVDDEFSGNFNTDLISGVAKEDTGDLLLLDLQRLIGKPDDLLTLIWDAQSQLDGMGASSNSEEQQLEQNVSHKDKELPPSQILPNFYDLYSPNSTPEEREIFRQRADNLKPQTESVKAINELMSLAVIGFDDEIFGLDLGLVREFTDISNLTPIPCCPNHIVGNMNLRGEIVTLVDIRNVLNLPDAPVSIGSQAVVVQVDDIVAGLVVDQVLEMVSLNAAELTPLPPPLSEFGEQYLRGIVFSEEKMMRVLDLPKLFTQGGLAVNDDA